MKNPFRTALAALLLVSSARAVAFYDMGTVVGGSHSLAYDVSDVGFATAGAVYVGGQEQACRWTPGVGISVLPNLPGYTLGGAYGISGDGTTVVGYSQTAGGFAQAVRWTQNNGAAQSLGTLGSISQAKAVSYNGSVITGEAYTSSGSRAFRWTQSGGLVSLGTLAGDTQSHGSGISSDGSVIVGESDYVNGQTYLAQAIRWTQAGGMTGLGWLAGDTYSQGFGISPEGSTIVGISGNAAGHHAFSWTQGGGMVPVGLLDAYGASANGSVIVGDVSGGAAIWDAAHGTRMVADILQASGINASAWLLGSVQDVSADGQVLVGISSWNGQLRGWMVVIPEPSAPAILVLAGVVLSLRRRQPIR